MPPGFDVVVPIFGGYALTASCLTHLQAQTVPHRVWVVDDCSPDDTPDRIEREFPAARVLRQSRNQGFAAACNRGIAAGDQPIVVILNNDVDCRPDFLEQLGAALDSHPAAGSAAPLLLRPDGAVDSVGLAADRTLAGFPRLQRQPVAAAAEPRPLLLGPSGAAAAYRRTALAAAGPLDETIFMYQEDLDLALRLRAGGFGAIAAPDAVGVHRGSATAGRRSARQRQNAGFSRGYLLRRYGVLRTRAWARALVTELAVMAGDAGISRDLAATRGRWTGWRAGRSERRPLPDEGIDPSLTMGQSLRLRRSDYRGATPSR